MTLLAREIGHYSFLQGAHVWVDGFQWFTPQQMEILRQIERAASKVTITLTSMKRIWHSSGGKRPCSTGLTKSIAI